MNEKNKDNYALYCIPRSHNENFLKIDLIGQLKREVFQEDIIIKNAKLISGCEIINFENRFAEILDLAYKSFLLGMYYSTVALASIAAERICYDFIKLTEIKFGKQILKENQKKTFYRIPYFQILKFLVDIKEIDEKIKNNLEKINKIRNRYIHPKFEGNPHSDAQKTLNLLCETIDLLKEYKYNKINE